MPGQRRFCKSQNELKGWKLDRTVEMRAEIDLRFGIIPRIELAWTKPGFQSAKSCRGCKNIWLRREINIDQWIRSIPQSKVSHSIRGRRIGGMLKFSGMNSPDEGSLESDGWCWFPQIKLNILIVSKIRYEDLAYQRLRLQRERIYGTYCVEAHEDFAI